MLPRSDEPEVLLSVVVTIVSGVVRLRRCLNHLLPQTRGSAIEVLVPYDSTVAGLEQLRQEFPQVVFPDMGAVRTDARPGTQAVIHEIFDRRTAKGLKLARGKVVAMLHDYGIPDPDWCQQILEAHRLPHGVVGGAVEHVGNGGRSWAVHFLDFGRYQLPLREGPSNYVTDMNVSYKRAALEAVGALWAERYKEATVNWALSKRGVVLWLRPQMVVRQDWDRPSFAQLLIERYSWGRLFGGIRTRELSWLARLGYIIGSPGIPAVLLGRMLRKVWSGRRHRAVFLRSLPQSVALTLVWCLGEWMGYLTGGECSLQQGRQQES